MRRRLLAVILGLSPWIGATVAAEPISGSITYQGELRSGAGLYSGSADFRVTLFAQADGGSAVGLTNTVGNVTVASGRFILPNLDFGPAGFTTGEARWMAIEVRTPSDPSNTGPFTLLTPRQPVSASPAAVVALSALSAQAAVSANLLNGAPPSFFQNAANLNSGTLPSARLAGAYTGALTLSNAANAFTGSGAGLTALNAGALSSGTVPDARLSPNILRLDGASATITGGPLNLNLPGSSASGVPGFPEVVLTARNTVTGHHTALSIDGKPGFDAILYLAENAAPVWSLRADSSMGKQLQVRLQEGGANSVALSLTTAGNMGLGTAPTANRLTVGGSIATTEGIVFPDGSIQRTAATLKGPQVNTDYVNDSFELTWNGDRALLESEISITQEVSENTAAPFDTGTRVMPGDVFVGRVTISRVLPGGTSSWFTHWNATTASNYATQGRSLVLTRTAFNPEGTATLTLTGMVPVSYSVQRDAAGQQFEYIELVSASGVPALPVFAGASLPSATFSSTSGLGLSIPTLSGFNSARLDVRTVNQGFLVAQFGIGRLKNTTFVRRPRREVLVSAPFGDSPQLVSWATQVMINGQNTRRGFSVTSGSSSVLSTAAGGGFPTRYVVKRGADGLYYEEWTLVGDSI